MTGLTILALVFAILCFVELNTESGSVNNISTYLFSAEGRGGRPLGTTVALVGFNDFLHIATLSVSILTPVTFTPGTLNTEFTLVSLVGGANRPARDSTNVLLDMAIRKVNQR
jgi:hypothetical protein